MVRFFQKLAALFKAETLNPDEEFVWETYNRIIRKAEPLTPEEEVIRLLVTLDTSVQSGGMYEYLVEYEETAASLPHALQSVGASSYLALLDTLLQETGIQLGSHRTFAEFDALYEAHVAAFDRFDEAYYTLSLHDSLMGYAARFIQR